MAEIKGRKIRLSNGRHVFVGQKEGCTDHYVEFKNGGCFQRFRLSDEAMDALLDIVASEMGEPESRSIADDDATGVHWRWQEVRVRDA